MKIVMLGTGNALVTECYNTCFILEDKGQKLMVDGGGGNTILHQIKKAGYDWMDINHIFVTHKHVDHLLGVIWMVRMICQYMNQGEYVKDAYIYSHKEVLDIIRDMAERLLQKKEVDFIGKKLHLVEVTDRSKQEIIGHVIMFFDIKSTKAIQYGFSMEIENDKKLVCCGDEPLNEDNNEYAKNCEWLLHEAYCLYSEKEIFNPYKKHHSTVKDACELAERLNAKNLLLYHMADNNLSNRKEMYKEEGQKYYQGSLYVPNDMEIINL